MDCSMPGFPVPHQLPEFAQVHLHWISDAIQPLHPLSPSFPSAFSLSVHWSLFQRVSCSHQVAKVLEFQAWVLPKSIQSCFILRLTGLISLLSSGLSRVFSSTTVWKYQYFCTLPSLLEKAMAPHSSTSAWKIPWTEEPGRLQSMGSLESDTTERLHFQFSLHALEKEMATHSSVLAWRIPGTGSLVGCRLWGRTESDTTEAT